MNVSGDGGKSVTGQHRELVELRREADRLRSENARLSRLLELRGQDTTPAPEQLAAASRQGPVSMASPSAAKVALFMDVFQARMDTYAIRRENCAMIAERAASTLILVDRKALAEQWRTRVSDFLGIKPGQIGGGRSKLTGVVDIAMLPTLARRDDVAELTAGYGQVVVDEAHHIAAAAYDHSVKAINARYWLGLTATPDRRDGLSELMTWQLGPVRHTMTNAEPGTLAAAADLDTGPARVLHLHETDFRYEVDPAAPIAEVSRALTLDEARNTQIVGDIAAAAARGRNCLVLTRRVAHLETLSAMLTEHGHTPVSLQGGMTTKARRAAVDRVADAKPGDEMVVIGTTPFIGEGFDAPALDTPFLAAPVSFNGLLVQCAGRIVRAAPGKQTAEVHDYHDHLVPLLAVSLQRRMPGYTALQFTTT